MYTSDSLSEAERHALDNPNHHLYVVADPAEDGFQAIRFGCKGKEKPAKHYYNDCDWSGGRNVKLDSDTTIGEECELATDSTGS